MLSWKLVAAWVAVLAATTALAWQIVSLADSQVSATPPEIVTATTTVPGASTSSVADPSTSTSADATQTTGSIATTSSTRAADPTTATWSVRTVTSLGGTVIVRHRPGEVELQAATPLPGFVVEIDDEGPDRVRVEFESEQADIRVEIRPRGDGVEVEIG